MKTKLLLLVIWWMMFLPKISFGEDIGVFYNKALAEKKMLLMVYPEGKMKSRFVFAKISFKEVINEMAPVSGYFGETVEKKYNLLNESYTDVIPLGPGSLSTRTVIRKPVIYSSINKIYKYYKSKCKQGKMSLAKAQDDWDYILEVGLTALYCETEELEKELRNLKTISEKIALFKSVELTD